MIVRHEAEGSLILINQGDHAKLSGILAAHWGNATFATPTPRESFVRGVAYHDCGWYSYETSPHYDPAAKSPPNFQQVPLDGRQLHAFQSGLDWLWDLDPYAGLLASRHRTGLWQRRYDAIGHPPPPKARVLGEDVLDFIRRNEARQNAAIEQLDADGFAANYQLLQVLDLMSLYLCTSEPVDDRIDYADAARGGAAVSLKLHPEPGHRIIIDPYPFDVDELPVSVTYRGLATREYESQEAFRIAYFGSPLSGLAFTLCRA